MPDEILLKIQADIRDLKSKVKQIESDFSGSSKKIGQHTDDLNKKFENMGKILQVVFAAAIIRKFTQALNAAVKAASDLEEQTAKFRTVFRGSLDEANRSVKELTENYGMSTREARQYMASVQDLLVPMGMARDKAAKLSAEIVRNAADFGSFNNTLTIEQIEKYKAALVGMYRPMRDNGVVLLDMDVRQRAVRDGLAKTTEEVTALQKALTAHKMILEQTADAQGDMARTADSYANASKRMSAAMEDFKASVGKNIMPALGFWKEELSKILKLTSEIMDLYNKETPKAASMQDYMKQKIVELRMAQQDYVDVLNRGAVEETEEIYNRKRLAELKEEEAWWQERLNKLMKAGRDIVYPNEEDVENADALNAQLAKEDELLAKILEKRRKEKEYAEKRWEIMMGILDKQEEELQKESEGLIGQLEENREEEEEKAQKALEATIKSQERLNQTWKDGIQYVIDLGDTIDIMFSKAEDKGQQIANLFWTALGGLVGFGLGGPEGAGIGARVGAGIGRATTSSVSDRRSAELSNRMVNSKTYTTYQIGV